jgi:hypothetical protein
MTITVDLRRVGSSRVSVKSIPLIARVYQGSVYGENLLKRRGITDPVQARKEVQDILAARMLGIEFEIQWEDSPDV